MLDKLKVNIFRVLSKTISYNWDKIFKNELSKFCGRQPSKNLLSPLLNTLSQLLMKFYAKIVPSKIFDRFLKQPPPKLFFSKMRA